jgi:hypothetical protein
VVKRAATELWAAQLGPEAGAVPYLPYLAYPARRGGPAAAPLLEASRALGAIARGPALARELAIGWAKRVSACGLEPPPAPLEISLAPGDRVRRAPRTSLVRMRWAGASIWAVNGHAFALRGRGERELRRILASLRGRGARVGALCGGDESLRAALEVLAGLRALEVVPAEDRT